MRGLICGFSLRDTELQQADPAPVRRGLGGSSPYRPHVAEVSRGAGSAQTDPFVVAVVYGDFDVVPVDLVIDGEPGGELLVARLPHRRVLSDSADRGQELGVLQLSVLKSCQVTARADPYSGIAVFVAGRAVHPPPHTAKVVT